MRRLAEADRIRSFMRALGASGPPETRVYFTGGVSAVLMGWRAATIDVDVSFVPDRDEVLRLLPALKNELDLNIELASPADFIPELPGWEDRSPFIVLTLYGGSAPRSRITARTAVSTDIGSPFTRTAMNGEFGGP